MIKCLFTERDTQEIFGSRSGHTVSRLDLPFTQLDITVLTDCSNITSPVPPRIVSNAQMRLEPGSQVPCSATGTPPIYIALVQDFTVLMNKTNTASSKLYQEGNYTCVATSKYGTDVKHFVIKGGEKIRYFETNTMFTELRVAT